MYGKHQGSLLSFLAKHKTSHKGSMYRTSACDGNSRERIAYY